MRRAPDMNSEMIDKIKAAMSIIDLSFLEGSKQEP